jgi:antitoxin component YwqK of YwqJK toxin-antitoxin module
MKPQIIQRDPQGNRHGVWEDYWLDGSPKWRGYYLHGKSHGVREYYQPDGTLLDKSYYLNVK